MTTKQLEDKAGIGSLGQGSYKIEIDYRGRTYTCHSNNSLAYDRISEHIYGENDLKHTDSTGGLTYKQALRSIWDECVSKNDLV